MADILDITTGALNGTGYFDKFMAALNTQIENQHNLGRIQGTDYATVYLGALQLALQQAVAYVGIVEQVSASQAKTAAEVSLLNQKTKTEEAQISDTVGAVTVAGAIGKQKALHQAQSDGFLRDAEQKATKILMDAWAISKSVSGDIIDPPDGAQNDDIEDMIIKLRQGIGVTQSIYKFAANAGTDRTVPISTAVQLDGTGSTYPGIDEENGENIATYAWVQTSGTSVTLNDANTVTPTFTAPGTADTLIFRLTITGDAGAPSTSFDEVTITVQ